MNYKEILSSRLLRIKIIQLFNFVPDIIMVRIQYWIKTGRFLNLKKPRRFTEKLQYYKLFYRDPLMMQCVDKYEVRDYIAKRGFSNILNECFGVYDEVEDINFENLPKSFVLKDTLGYGGNSVIIVKDKSSIDYDNIKSIMKSWTDTPFNKKHPGREWVYDRRKHRIIIEKYIESDPDSGGLIDYKFFCSYGEIKFLYVIADRNLGDKAGIGIYNKEFKLMGVNRADEKPLERLITKPDNYGDLIKIAEVLSEPFPEARIDFYNENSNIVFGEITFFDGSGYMPFEPDEYDKILGDMFTFKDSKFWNS